MDMKCPICGKDLSENAARCDRCGYLFQPPAPPAPTPRPNRPWLLGAFMAALLAAGLCIGLLLAHRPGEPAVPSGPAQTASSPPTRPSATTPPVTGPPMIDPAPQYVYPLYRNALWSGGIALYYDLNFNKDLRTLICQKEDRYWCLSFSFDDFDTFYMDHQFDHFSLSTLEDPDNSQPRVQYNGDIDHSPDRRHIFATLRQGNRILNTFEFTFDPSGLLLTQVHCTGAGLPWTDLALTYQAPAGDGGIPGPLLSAAFSGGEGERQLSYIYAADGRLSGFSDGTQQYTCTYSGSLSHIRDDSGAVLCSIRHTQQQQLWPGNLREYQFQLVLTVLLGLDPAPLLPVILLPGA